jgi:hypothetical protein
LHEQFFGDHPIAVAQKTAQNFEDLCVHLDRQTHPVKQAISKMENERAKRVRARGLLNDHVAASLATLVNNAITVLLKN